MIAPETRVIPPGEFDMGESETDKFANDTERPRHRVKIPRAFRLGAFPITVADYRRFDPGYAPDDDSALPAVSVTWLAASEYCGWLSASNGESWRLPSEAEWEYACRAGRSAPFYDGAELDASIANFLHDEHGERVGRGHRTAAGTFAPNAFGLEAMHGNVCEWCADTWHPDYRNAPVDGSSWMEGGRRDWRVIRGGAWDYLPRMLRSAWRDALPETTRRDNVGFRIACDMP